PDLPAIASPLEFFIVIPAPGITAPVGSVTCPCRRPMGDCATIAAVRIVMRETATARRHLDDQGFIKLSSNHFSSSLRSGFTPGRAQGPSGKERSGGHSVRRGRQNRFHTAQ